MNRSVLSSQSIQAKGWRGYGCRRYLGLLALGCLLTGCSSTIPRDLMLGDGWRPESLVVRTYKPENIFLQANVLPRSIRRVALLPLSSDSQRPDLADVCEVLAPIVQAELTRTKKFEIVAVNAELLRERTGRSSWTGGEVLPLKFFEALNEASGCDAVLFCQLTTFRAYPPLAIGWRMKLVDARTRQVLWAGDEVFNAGQPGVLKGMRRFLLDEERTSRRTPDEWTMRNSPRQFAQYTSARLLTTLPNR